MFEILRNAWKIADLRKKLLYTLMIVLIFRIGAALPVPYLDPAQLSTMIGEGNLLGYLDILTGGAFSSATLFSMSVTPYINASIIMQLLTVAIPALERLAKEGEEGKKVLGRITRYLTLGLSLLQAIMYYLLLKRENALIYSAGFEGIFSAAVIVLSFTAGSALIVWLGEQINAKGIGNGISILLFAGILSRGPAAVSALLKYWTLAQQGDIKYYFMVPGVVVLFLLVVAFIIILSNAERKIPVQYAKRVVGRKMYGGQNTHIPIKVNMSGVMPIIFASSFVAIPGTIRGFVNVKAGGFWDIVLGVFKYNSWLYAGIYFLLIIFFNYFYVAIQYNPIEIANNLRKNNGGIPGIRPGKPTSDFISKVLSRITLIGAFFLGVIAVLPIMLGSIAGMDIALGGTSILILVGVALETTRQIESQMMMRHYKGFLE